MKPIDEELVDVELEAEALRRLAAIDENTELVSHQDVLESLGLTEEDLDMNIDLE